MKVVVSYRYGTIFRSVVDMPAANWCDVMAGSGLGNLYLKMVIDLIKDNSGDLFRRCPYDVSSNIRRL